MIKGCINTECNSFQKNKKYKDNEFEFCPECGSKLEHVCKKCPTVVNDDKQKLCLHCQAAKEERNAKIVDNGKKVLGGVAGVVVAAGGALQFFKKNE